MLIDKNTISNIVYKIASNVNPDKIFLFGSYATGHANEDSDIDIAVILNDYNNLREIQLDLMRLRRKIDKRSIEIQRLLIGSKLPVDVLVYTNDEFEKEKSAQYSFVNSAIQGAQLLYERK